MVQLVHLQMKDLVTKRSFLMRRKLDSLLHRAFPTWWIPLYSSVAFTRMRYHHCILNRKWQDDVSNLICKSN